MSARRQAWIQGYTAACALGPRPAQIAPALFAATPQTVSSHASLLDGRSVPVGRLPFDIGPHLPDDVTGRSRTNRLLTHAYADIAPLAAAMIETYGAHRVGVVVGTSTAGVGEGGEAIAARLGDRPWPAGFDFDVQELYDPARALVQLSGAGGPAYVVSTACTSGAKAIAAGARMIVADLCDAVICGGVDSLCDLTLNGFGALEALSDVVSNPFSVNRKGINIGEGAGLFVLSREPSGHRVAGWGESSDAHHISAPDPTGTGAETAARKALAMAGLDAADIGYVHLHGTGTSLNDRMEAGAVNRVFGPDTPCSSTKPMTGHTLGAAGALQAAFCLMSATDGRLPPHLWDGELDPELAPVRLVQPGDSDRAGRYSLSASYAFGGNNAALILASE